MNKYIKDFLSYAKWERRGVILLISLVLGLAIFPYLYDMKLPPENQDLQKFTTEVNEFIANTRIDSSELEGKSFGSYERFAKMPEFVPESFPFDPNGLPAESWKRLGLKDWQIKIIKNYEQKGGKFYKKEDVQHMYGMKEELYDRLEPFIHIQEQARKPLFVHEKRDSSSCIRKPVLHLDLSSADSATLIQIGGIGPSFASRIVKYRNNLGGFYKKEQLLEVYGMDTSRYVQIAKYLTLADTSQLKKININTILIPQLKHPYLNFVQVNALVNYRRMHGKYKDISDIKKTIVVTPEIYARIRPYLSLD